MAPIGGLTVSDLRLHTLVVIALTKPLLGLNEKLSNIPHKQFSLLSGYDIELWLLKVYCGAVAARHFRDHDQNVVEQLDQRWLDILVGIKPWPQGWGLYAWAKLGDNIQVMQKLQFGTLTVTGDGSNAPAGCVAKIAGFSFVLYLSDYNQEKRQEEGFRYHLQLIKTKVRGKKTVFAMTY